jgi:hypothetical protein
MNDEPGMMSLIFHHSPFIIHRLIYESGWESNPPTPAARNRPLILKTRAATGRHPPPDEILPYLTDILNRFQILAIDPDSLTLSSQSILSNLTPPHLRDIFLA